MKRIDSGESEAVFMDGHSGIGGRARCRGARGGGKLKAVIYTLIMVLVIYAGVKIIPVYLADYQLADKMQEQARFAVVNRFNEEQVRESIYRVVKDLGIPAERDAIRVYADTSQVRISLSYTVPVEILFYHLDLHFSPTSEGKSLI